MTHSPPTDLLDEQLSKFDALVRRTARVNPGAAIVDLGVFVERLEAVVPKLLGIDQPIRGQEWSTLEKRSPAFSLSSKTKATLAELGSNFEEIRKRRIVGAHDRAERPLLNEATVLRDLEGLKECALALALALRNAGATTDLGAEIAKDSPFFREDWVLYRILGVLDHADAPHAEISEEVEAQAHPKLPQLHERWDRQVQPKPPAQRIVFLLKALSIDVDADGYPAGLYECARALADRFGDRIPGLVAELSFIKRPEVPRLATPAQLIEGLPGVPPAWTQPLEGCPTLRRPPEVSDLPHLAAALQTLAARHGVDYLLAHTRDWLAPRLRGSDEAGLLDPARLGRHEGHDVDPAETWVAFLDLLLREGPNALLALLRIAQRDGFRLSARSRRA